MVKLFGAIKMKIEISDKLIRRAIADACDHMIYDYWDKAVLKVAKVPPKRVLVDIAMKDPQFINNITEAYLDNYLYLDAITSTILDLEIGMICEINNSCKIMYEKMADIVELEQRKSEVNESIKLLTKFGYTIKPPKKK